MAPLRLVFILISILTLTFFLTFISLSRSHSRHYAAAATSTGQSSFRSLFSFRTPSALFPSSAIISLTDDNSTFFLSRPAEFGPSLPSDGLSAQLWVGSGFSDDSLGRGFATESEGELGCSDVPGWHTGRKHHQGDSPFEPSARFEGGNLPSSQLSSSQNKRPESRGADARALDNHGLGAPSEDDGTDDHLHHPLPDSQVVKPTAPGQAADADRSSSRLSPQHADIQSLQESAEISGKLVLLTRGGCGFLEKVKWVQRRGGVGLIVGDNTRGGALVTMYARGDTSNITVPALFTSRTTAHLLSSLIPADGSDGDNAAIQSSDTDYDEGTGAGPNGNRPTFTPTGALPRSTSASPAKARTDRSENNMKRVEQLKGRKGWFGSIFSSNSKKHASSFENGAMEDSRRPPSSGRLTWVNEQWTEMAVTPGEEKLKSAEIELQTGKQSRYSSGAHPSTGDEFEIGVHDWRDPDLVGAVLAASSTSTASTAPAKNPVSTGVVDHELVGSGGAKTLSGGSITPSSGEYGRPGVGSISPYKVPGERPASHQQKDASAQSWSRRLLWGSRDAEAGQKLGPAGDTHSREDHEGLWVTLTPTTVSTSPFFDTLLVLVVSPLITLTVVYSLLLIRSRIRRRRWRAPKSVVERLPVRTYHTMSCSSTTSSSQLVTPLVSSPTSPLLQSSLRSVTSRTRLRAYTASGIGDAVADSLDQATAKAALKQQEATDLPACNAKRRQYHGKQVECVVCLEEYVDGQSQVMSLPCGHEFHAECITPWLTTRRRTCPICKGDVVRSMGKPENMPAKTSAQPRRSGNAEHDEDVQAQAAETRNESPTAAIPIPRDAADLERGDDMAATLVNDAPEASSSRRGWYGLASFSLSAFSGEGTWRQAQADRNRVPSVRHFHSINIENGLINTWDPRLNTYPAQPYYIILAQRSNPPIRTFHATSPLSDVVSVGASVAFATDSSESEECIHRWPLTASRKMRRFGSDQMPLSFSPQAPGPSYYRPPARVPYSHIQLVHQPDVTRPSQSQHASQQVTFRKASYSKEAEQLATQHEPLAEDHRGQTIMSAAAPAPLPSKPTASLANMTSGTTFAAKARAAELNAVRARRAIKDTIDQDDTTVPTAISGSVKLSKPRSRGRGGWKPLNLDEIPETTTEADQLAYHHQLASTGLVPSATSEQHPYPEELQFSQQLDNDTPTDQVYIHQEHMRHQMNQFKQLALQRQILQYPSSAASTFVPQYHAPLRGSPEPMAQERKSTNDDPFTDVPPTTYRLPVPAFEYDRQLVTDVAGLSNPSTPPMGGETMDYRLRFPTEHQERRNIPPPPGLPVSSSYIAEAYLKHKPSTTSRQPAAMADTYQRDPKPYTNFSRSSDDSSKRDRLLQGFQQASDRSKMQGDVLPSTRTVLYDPVVQDIRASATAHGHTVSQSDDDILKSSEPLEWKNRPVDIYNTVLPALAAPCLSDGEQAATEAMKFGGAAYDYSSTTKASSAQQRQKEAETWWYHDGRGQQHLRTWLECVAEDHRKKKAGQDYESMKKSLERQASFRDDWSDSTNMTNVAEAVTSDEAVDLLLGPVLANLHSYNEDSGPAYFNKFTKAPAWAVDGGVEGNKSFFEETWGKPPSRVGRDPRYRPTFHEGRYTVFEPTDGRVSGRGGW
ncbi:MAG: hypothetical protein Q9169_004738 [Polycauliona sp. 2 TL-2023]